MAETSNAYTSANDILKELAIPPGPERDNDKRLSNIASDQLAAFAEPPRSFMRTTIALDQSSSTKDYVVGNIDKAWMYKSGRSKLSHLLQDPPCTCGATARLHLHKGRKGTLAIIHDTHRHIDPQGWRNERQIGALQTEEIEQKMKVKIPSVQIEEDNYTVRVSDHPEHKNTLPNLQPASAHQMMALLNNAEQLVAAWSLRIVEGGDALYDGDANQPIHILRLMQVVHEEQMLYNALFYEVIRQCTVHCTERGHILSDLRRRYAELFSQIPSYLINIHNEMLVQRSIERRLAEVFIGYKQWWDAMQFQFEHFKEVKPVLNRLQETQNDVSNSMRLISVLDDSGQLFNQYVRLFAIQRAHLQQDQQDMQFEKQVWQDATYQLVSELVQDPNYLIFKSLHSAQIKWLSAAQQTYQMILLNDQKLVLELRDLAKTWLGSLSHLEKRLLDYDKGIFNVLDEIREELELCIALFLAREGERDEEVTVNIRDYFRKWNLGMNRMLNKFKADESEKNLQFLQAIQTDFETLISRILTLLVSQYQREKDRGTNLSRVRHETESIRILNATEPDYFTKHSSIADSHFHKLSAAGLLTLFPLDQAKESSTFQLDLIDADFDTSVKTFEKSARFQADSCKLRLLRDSQLYAGTYSLWKMYEDVRSMSENRIIGGTGIPLEVTELEERFEHIRALTAHDAYFIGAEPGRFHSAAYALLHQLKHLLYRIQNNDDVITAQSALANKNIRNFVNSAKTWFLFCEGGMEARTQNILQDIDFISESMLRLELKLMTIIVPDRTFEELRYQHLYRKQTEKTITDRLEQVELQFNAVSREISNLSRMLDEQIASLPSDQKPNDTTVKVIPLAENWGGIAAVLIDRAYRVSNVERSDISSVPLLNYLHKLQTLEEKKPDQLFNFEELSSQIEHHADKKDFVELRLQGDEINLYVKPFGLFGTERESQIIDEQVIQLQISHLSAEVRKQQILNDQIEKRVQDLQSAVVEAKRSLEKNRTLAYYLEIDKTPKNTTAPQFTDVAMDEMEALLRKVPPDVLRHQPEIDIWSLRTLPGWDQLTREHGNESQKLDGRFDFETRMGQLRDNLKDSEEHLQNKKFLLAPFISTNDDKKQAFLQKKAEREEKKVRRRLTMRGSRTRRRSRSSSVYST